ncbi:hypothetical protein ICW_05657 [Bacillus wiedmannii]|uniref:hypothetical protein n=1 Tax=Bacillus wiedmannii TaxID=1890302 RepID=UPI00027AB898|nr:hypothetical protein [Bacillus wiedmannii]EJS62994.1 hypothetical protein ICW_05657 [Bacillus wiedmannii]
MTWVDILIQPHKDKIEILNEEIKECKDDSVKKFLIELKRKSELKIDKYNSWR